MNEIVISKDFAIPTKMEVANQASKLIEQVKEGEVSAMMVYAIMTALEKVASDVKKGIMENVLTEHERYGEKTTTAYGVTYERCEVGVKYDYSEDEEWLMLEDNIKAIRTEQKARELILKETGRCGKSSTTSVKVTLAK
jgi:CRISPR/Cas system CSM-associated protein Csm3 (group 7 of RAMP superfamily)